VGAVSADRPRVLAVRVDSDGDVLLSGPALRRLRACADRLDLLVSPAGTSAAMLLPGIDEVLVADVPWSGTSPAAPDPEALTALLECVRAGAYDEVVVLTSYHQSPLPMALVAKWAGVPRVVGTSDAYPGSLLDLRHRRMPDGTDDPGHGGGHEVEAMCALVEAAGYPCPEGDDDRLRIRPVSAPRHLPTPYVVVHPTASVPARGIEAGTARAYAERLLADGWHVLVTAGPGEEPVGRAVTPPGALDLAGRTSLTELAGVLAGAAAVVVGNTGPAHLAAAVGTPVVSIFAPVVPAERWAPWGVPSVVLGDQGAACRASRARTCPVPGHPCVSGVTPGEVSAAVARLAGSPVAAPVATGTADLRAVVS
jgi:ADP-heptose:LPS heptosyltransferase